MFNWNIQIREKYRQSGRMIQRWHEYIERTSNYDKLLQAKKNMGRQINQSKIRSKNARKTIQHKNRLELNTTTFQVSWGVCKHFSKMILGSTNNYREYTFGDNANARSKILIFIKTQISIFLINILYSRSQLSLHLEQGPAGRRPKGRTDRSMET